MGRGLTAGTILAGIALLAYIFTRQGREVGDRGFGFLRSSLQGLGSDDETNEAEPEGSPPATPTPDEGDPAPGPRVDPDTGGPEGSGVRIDDDDPQPGAVDPSPRTPPLDLDQDDRGAPLLDPNDRGGLLNALRATYTGDELRDAARSGAEVPGVTSSREDRIARRNALAEELRERREAQAAEIASAADRRQANALVAGFTSAEAVAKRRQQLAGLGLVLNQDGTITKAAPTPRAQARATPRVDPAEAARQSRIRAAAEEGARGSTTHYSRTGSRPPSGFGRSREEILAALAASRGDGRGI